MIQSRHVPAFDDAPGRDERCSRVDHGRAAINAAESQRHRAVGGEETAGVLVQRVGHVELAARKLVVSEPSSLLEEQHAAAVRDELAELLSDRAATSAG